MINSVSTNSITNKIEMIEKESKKIASMTRENLFVLTDTKLDINSEEASVEQKMIEAQIAQYEQELQKLEAQKSVLQAEQKALNAQKQSLIQRSNAIQNEIDANNVQIEKYTNEAMNMNEMAVLEEESIEELQKQYDAMNQEAQELSNEITVKVAEMVANSKEDLNEQKNIIAAVTEEAYEKVAAGEIEESEVPSYVASKTNYSVNANSSNELAAINSLNGQVKLLIASANNTINTMTSKQTNIQELKSQISVKNDNINTLTTQNQEKVASKSALDKQIETITVELNSINKQCAAYDAKINTTKANIALAKNEKSSQVNTVDAKQENKQEVAKSKNNSAITYNPFVSIAYENVDYTDMVSALNAMSTNNDLVINDTLATEQENKQEIRNLFHQFINA